ncbi:ATP-binding protein [Treponema peruense]
MSSRNVDVLLKFKNIDILSNRNSTYFMELLQRNDYLQKLKDTIGTPDIKVITGIRRAGKSKLLVLFEDYLRTQNNTNIIHIDFNLTDFENLAEYHALELYIKERKSDNKQNFVLIDEIQMCSGFEKAVNSLHASDLYQIYITGSNAFLLSSDLATLFTGRTFEIHVFPFSLSEYMQFFKMKDSYSELDSYIKEGGMPGSYLYKSIEDKYRYISKDVFNALVVRYILGKRKIKNTVLLDRLVDFLMDNISNITSIRNIASCLETTKMTANSKTIGSYIDYLCASFAFYKIRRYDIRGKRYLSSEDKYYLADHSFKYARLGTKNMDWGRMLENIVAIELMRRGYELYVGKLYQKEIDFVAIKQNEKLYIQVSDYIGDGQTFEREINPLLAIKDAYPKILLSRTRQSEYLYEGIRVIDISTWLTSINNSQEQL